MKTFLKKVNMLFVLGFFALAPFVSFAEDAEFVTHKPNTIQSNGATFFGVLKSAPGSGVFVWFEYGTSRNSLNKKTDKIKTNSILVNIPVENLEQQSVYFYRAVVEQKDGSTDKGSVVSFRTLRAYAQLTSPSSNDGSSYIKEGVKSGTDAVKQSSSGISDYNFFASFFGDRKAKADAKEKEEKEKAYQEKLEEERLENERLVQLLEQEKVRQAQLASAYKNSAQFRSNQNSHRASASVASAGSATGLNYTTLLLIAVMMFVVIGLLYMIVRRRKSRSYARSAIYRNHNPHVQYPSQPPQVPHHYDPRYHR